MGEARAKRLAAARNPCRCGSGRPGGDCCFAGGRWHKSPARIELGGPGRTHSLPGCYLAAENSCCETLSREHLVSEVVLKALQKEALVVSGLPWLPKGERRSIGLASLVAKCLCKSHNSDLSPLDDEAGRLFRSIDTTDLERPGGEARYIFSGHDVERWFLKTLLAMAHSSNFAANGERLNARLDPQIDFARLLTRPEAWPRGAGLYFSQRVGERFVRADELQLAPLYREGGEIVGLYIVLQGLRFDFWAIAPDNGAQLHSPGYRPASLAFTLGPARNVVELSWEDGLQHLAAIFDMQITPRDQLGDLAGLP